MPPLIGSPAYDAAGPTAFPTDQRGFARVVGPAPDIGSVESTEARPTVITLAPTGVSGTNATFRSSVIPGSQTARAWFQWGHTTNYGQATPGTTLPSGLNASNVTELLASLTAGASYHGLECGGPVVWSGYFLLGAGVDAHPAHHADQ
jgi:hypothetical protein